MAEDKMEAKAPDEKKHNKHLNKFNVGMAIFILIIGFAGGCFAQKCSIPLKNKMEFLNPPDHFRSTRLETQVSKADFEDLVKFIYCETEGSRDYNHELALLDAVLTRVQLPNYPNNIHDVLFGGEFRTIINGEFYLNGKVIQFTDIPEDLRAQLGEVVSLSLSGEGYYNDPEYR